MSASPVLFLSHGAPDIVLHDSPTLRWWRHLASRLEQSPRLVLCISAHWDAPEPSLAGGVERPSLLYDFFGFPGPLYDITWALPDAREAARWLLGELADDGVVVRTDPQRGLDHGVWIPLRTMWPVAPAPVLQLSLSLARDPAWHLELGRRLAPLREHGVVIVASGGVVHNLRRLEWRAPENGAAPPWAREFVDAVEHALQAGDEAALCDPWSLPHGELCHPTLEHYVPLLVAAGAAGAPLQPLHRAWSYGSLALHAYGSDLV